MTALELKAKIEKLRKGATNKFATATDKRLMESALKKAEAMLVDLEKAEKELADKEKEAKKPAIKGKGRPKKTAETENKQAVEKVTKAIKKKENLLDEIEKLMKENEAVMELYANVSKEEIEIERDAQRQAKPCGRRVSITGKEYTENRPNKCDVTQNKKYPKLKEGGEVSQLENISIYGYDTIWFGSYPAISDKFGRAMVKLEMKYGEDAQENESYLVETKALAKMAEYVDAILHTVFDADVIGKESADIISEVVAGLQQVGIYNFKSGMLVDTDFLGSIMDELIGEVNGGGNGYKGKSPAQIWDNWTVPQRKHFIKDHMLNMGFETDREDFWMHYKGDYAQLPERAKEEISVHIREGQYAKGGKIGSVMHKYKNNQLKDRWGNTVKDRRQAIAIAMSESRKSGKMKHGGEVGVVIIGYTETGLPIHGKYDHEKHSDFSENDHKDAGHQHCEIAFVAEDKEDADYHMGEAQKHIAKGMEMAHGGKIHEKFEPIKHKPKDANRSSVKSEENKINTSFDTIETIRTNPKITNKSSAYLTACEQFEAQALQYATNENFMCRKSAKEVSINCDKAKNAIAQGEGEYAVYSAAHMAEGWLAKAWNNAD